MAATMKKQTVKLPRLRTKDELCKASEGERKGCTTVRARCAAANPRPLHACNSKALYINHLQTQPELLKLFGEDPEAEGQSMSNFIPSKPAHRNAGVAALKPMGGKPGQIETPRDFEEELTEEELLRLELEKVKHERLMLMQSIASAKAQSGK